MNSHRAIAYFTMEIGLDADMPAYSGSMLNIKNVTSLG